MDQQKQLTQKEALEKLEELKKKVGIGYYDPCAYFFYKENSPPRYVIYMQEQIERNPELAIKDISTGGESLIVRLAEEDERYEVLKFMLDHGASAEVKSKWSGQNAALYKALWTNHDNPALKNARLLLERGAPAKFKGPWFVRNPENNPRIQLLIEFGAHIDEFILKEWFGGGGLP